MAVSHSPVCYFLSDGLWASEIPFVLVGLCLLKKNPAGLQKGVWMEDRVCKLHRLLLVASHPRVAQLGGRRAVPDLVKPRSAEPLPPSLLHALLSPWLSRWHLLSVSSSSLSVPVFAAASPRLASVGVLPGSPAHLFSYSFAVSCVPFASHTFFWARERRGIV